MNSTKKPSLYYVQITEPTTGKFRIFYLYEGIDSNEFKDLFQVSFDNITGVVGFCDENGVFFPVSLLSSKPQLFGGRKLTIVTSKTPINSKLMPLSDNDSEDTIVTEDQVSKAFRLLDMNKDGFVHKEEFIQFMTTAYSTLFDIDPGLAFAYSCVDNKDLAIATAVTCYQACNPAGNYYLTYDDFCSWYMSCGFEPLRELTIKAIIAYTTRHSNDTDIKQSSPMLKRSKSWAYLNIGQCYEDLSIQIFIEHCKEIFPLHSRVAIISFLEHLAKELKPSTPLSYTNMKSLLSKYVKGDEQQQVEHQEIIQQILELLFTIIADKSTEMLTCSQLVSFFLFCSPLQTREVYTILFASYHTGSSSDSDGEPLVNDLILYHQLYPIIKCIYFFNPEYASTTQCEADQLTHAVYIKLLMSVDAQRKARGKLSFSEFLELYVHGLKIALSILEIDRGYFVELLSRLVGYEVETVPDHKEDDDEDDDEEDEEEEDDEDEEAAERALTAGVDGQYPSVDSLEDDQVSSFFVGYNGSPITIAHGRSIFGLVDYTTYDVVKYLMQLCDSEGFITPMMFSRGVLRLIGDHYIELSVLERSTADFMLDRLMETFNNVITHPQSSTTSKDVTTTVGGYSFFDICIGLLLFCEDDTYNRAEIILALLRPKAIRLSTVTSVLAILFKACYCLHPGLSKKEYNRKAEADSRAFCIQYYMKEVSPKFGEVTNFTNSQFIQVINVALAYLDEESERIHQAAAVASEKVKGTSDIFSDSFTRELEELDAKFNKDNDDDNDDKEEGANSLRSFSDDEDDDEGLRLYLNDEKFPPSSTVLELRAAASILGLERYRADSLLDKLGKKSFAGRLPASGWANWLSQVMQDTQLSEYDIDLAINLSNKLFAALQHGGDEDIAFNQVVAGLAFLCTKSPIEERLMVAFTVMDENSDGLISYAQTELLIRSVIIVMAVSSSQVAKKILALGVSVDELAEAAVQEGYGALELQPEDELSLEMLCDLAEDYVKLASIV